MTELEGLLDGERWPALAATLSPWLCRQRWFAGKARSLSACRVVDVALLRDSIALVILEVGYEDGGAERYQVPIAPGEPAIVSFDGVALCDATEAPAAMAALAAASLSPDGGTSAAGGVVVGSPVEGHPDVELTRVRRLGVEQSNTSVVLDDALILKVFRRLEAGVHPDVEITRALTEAGFPHVPAQAGALRLERSGAEPMYLAVLASFLHGAREGWDLATAEASAVAAGTAEPRLEGALHDLGRVVAGLHVALRAAFGYEPGGPQAAAAWASELRDKAGVVLDLAAARAPQDTAQVTKNRDRLLARFDDLAGVHDPGVLLRTHGDLHLGQVVLDRDGAWQVLDFEGEPARPLAERRRLSTPLRDVAGVLRSVDYAAASASLDPPPALAEWRDRLRQAFVDGYRAVAVPEGLVPDAAWPALLAAFELDKAVYELGYELANRPDWVAIPVAGILRVLGAGEAAHQPDDDPQQIKERSVPTSQSTGARPPWQADPTEVEALLRGSHRDPHALLGPHEVGSGAVVRALRPEATAVEVVLDGRSVEATRTHEAGFFEAPLDAMPKANAYRLRVQYADDTFDQWDAYGFWPTFGDVDLHLVGEGRHEELWRRMGATLTEIDGVAGVAFAVWAPNARSVRVIGDFNSWDGRLHPMRMLGASGIWELFVPDVGNGTRYQYEVVTAHGRVVNRADPFAKWAEVPPAQASRVFYSEHTWGDDDWLARRAASDPLREPMSVYEVHLGSWRHVPGEDGASSPLSYRDLAHQLAEHCTELGFTHVELLPVAEHPFGGSWGYQVSGYYAPTSRFGDPDDFRYLVDHLHRNGIGVIVDWVPAHFPKDEWALARFDGTALYEHLDPRKGEHPDWGTLVFNFGRNEVRNFLIANALFWIEELHVDGLRVDAVASMLYLDYSRGPGEWVPNEHGGRENLEAVSFLQELNRTVYGRNPGALMIAEESTAWPGVTRPVHLGGLGFGFKWNMGWMHDSLAYMSRDPVYRRYHHHEMTFGLMYAWSEHFVLPLSHDEVVHGKRSLLDKMPGDRWQKFANLRSLYAWMWAHPGKQLLFMGGEFGQWREWSEQRSLDWHLLDESGHRGLQRLVGDLNHRYRELAALWSRDPEPDSFQWIDANNADANFFAFLRRGAEGEPNLVCLANMSPVPLRGIRVGLPQAGAWREVLNTDAEVYGGGNVGNYGLVHAAPEPSHGQPASAEVVLPPLGTVWLRPDETAPPDDDPGDEAPPTTAT